VGAHIEGMDEWIRTLETLPERAPAKLTPVMKRAGGNMKDDWSARWTAMPHEHIPHLVKVQALSYDTSERNGTYSVEVGVRRGRLQSRLASFIEYGTLTSRPHPAGVPALEAEAPRMADAAVKAFAELLDKT
jgi:hypothetical protein